MGKKKLNKKTGMVEFTLYKDLEELKAHYRAKHYVCRKGFPECEHLAFID